MDYKYSFVADLSGEVEVPRDGILSRILLKNESVNVTLFGFSAGQELTEHTASAPAVVQILQGEAQLTVGGDELVARPGAWLYMPARTPHTLVAKTPVVMLLVLLKGQPEA